MIQTSGGPSLSALSKTPRMGRGSGSPPSLIHHLSISHSLYRPTRRRVDVSECEGVCSLTFLHHSHLVPKMMKETMTYLEKRKVQYISSFYIQYGSSCHFPPPPPPPLQKEDPSFTYEVVIVNDGSPDRTSQVDANNRNPTHYVI